MRLRMPFRATGNRLRERLMYLRPPISWRGLGALVLGVLLAQWSWVLFAPHTVAIVNAPQPDAAAESGRLFGVAALSAPAAEGVALPNVKLVGVFTAALGRPGFAILKLDDKHQVGVATGENVATGTRLVEVHPDYVLLERAGMRQRVNLEKMNMENKYAGGNQYAGSYGMAAAPAVAAQQLDRSLMQVQKAGGRK